MKMAPSLQNSSLARSIGLSRLTNVANEISVRHKRSERDNKELKINIQTLNC